MVIADARLNVSLDLRRDVKENRLSGRIEEAVFLRQDSGEAVQEPAFSV